MRLRRGRPDLAVYDELFAVHTATANSALRVTFLGVSTLHVTDGVTSLLTDGFFSRPGLARVVAWRIAPKAERIDAALRNARIDRLDAVLPVHTHYDHALDSGFIAERTGAVLVGGSSAARLGRGAGLPPDRIHRAVPREPIHFGSFSVTPRDYWQHTVHTVGARRVVLTHWDDFFRPLDEPLQALPYAGDDLDVTLRLLRRFAERDGVELLMPRVWVPEAPWSRLT